MTRFIPQTPLGPFRMRSLLSGIVAACALVNHTTAAVIDLKRGDPAPPLELTAIDEVLVETAKMRGRTVILHFAQAGQPNTQRAVEHIGAVVNAARLADAPIEWIVIYSKSSDPEAIEAEMATVQARRRRPVVVHDTAREAYAAYQVVVTPSVVVVDGEGRVVHAMAGLVPRFADLIADSVHVAAGKITAEQFENSLNHSAGDSPDEGHVRAERLTRLAYRLAQRGMASAAEDEFRQALKLAPDLTSARLGLADLLLSQMQLSEALAHYQAVLRDQPQSIDASVGVAMVLVAQGGDELEQAERLARICIERSPQHARAHFVIGLIHEQRDEHEQAAAAFKTAAELFMRMVRADASSGDDPS